MDERIINMAINRCNKRKDTWVDDLNWADEQEDKQEMESASDKIKQEKVTIFALKQLLNKPE